MVWTSESNLFLKTFPCLSMETAFYLNIFSICPLDHSFPSIILNLLVRWASVWYLFTYPTPGYLNWTLLMHSRYSVYVVSSLWVRAGSKSHVPTCKITFVTLYVGTMASASNSSTSNMAVPPSTCFSVLKVTSSSMTVGIPYHQHRLYFERNNSFHQGLLSLSHCSYPLV